MSRLGIFESIVDPAFVADTEGSLIESNSTFDELLGSSQIGLQIAEVWPQAAEFWQPALAAGASGKQLRVDIRANAVDGRELVFDVRMFQVDDYETGERTVVGVARDVTAERFQAHEMEINATTDSLTGAFNQGQMEVLLSQAIRSARRRKTTSCFIFIDVDDFKSINDTYGHDEGDSVLTRIVGVLHANLRDSDVIARIVGDEFGVILTDSDPVSGPVKAAQIRLALNAVAVNGNPNGILVSIGLTVFPLENDQAGDVIKRADTAMYTAKRTQSQEVEVWGND
jgi:diguanylate cyclase (GGDEF)-like protein/PAS domain S-box-containing protein